MEITLSQLELLLKSLNPEDYLDFGFTRPHSYRGMYDCLCFEVDNSVKVSEMLLSIQRAYNNTFSGWKGGEYDYNADTPVFFAYQGCTESGVGCHEYYGDLTDIRQYFYALINGDK